MTTKYRIVNWEFNRFKLSQEIVYAVNMRGLGIAEIAASAGVSPAAVKDLKDGNHKNPEMKTLLGVINALDLDPRDFFQLGD